MSKRKPKEHVLHERYNSDHPLLRELVSIAVFSFDESVFSTKLTRVPCVGEVIVEEDRMYRVQAVEHIRVDNDGRTIAGYHAFVDVIQIVDEFPSKPFRLRTLLKRQIKSTLRMRKQNAGTNMTTKSKITDTTSCQTSPSPPS